MSYAELDRAANGVAGRLGATGVRRGDRVGFFSTRSFDAIAAAFGILRAGAAYVPLDPTMSETRTKSVLMDCQLHSVLVDGPLVGLLPNDVGKLSLSDAMASGTPPQAQDRSAEDLSYILYSSGSTGTPKGICHTHASGMAYARMSAELCALTPQDRVSHHTPMHFDMSIFDIFATTLAGATIVVIPEMHAKMPASLSSLVQEEGVTVWYSVPFALAQMVKRGALHDRDLSTLRIVMFAGEVMPPSVLAALAPHVPGAELLNAYGPTETNHCTTARIDRATLDGQSAIPIGQPDAGIDAWISPTGELLISGDQVMTGYWNAPERTANVMIEIETDGVTRRYYRTADIVTQDANGLLWLIGRADRQIKLRGYRIELDEVELVLGACRGVDEIAVTPHAQGETLVAYVVGSADIADLTHHATEHLPFYAVPGRFLKLHALARTSTGKIDRLSLERLADDH